MAEEMDISYGDITFEMVDGAGKITFSDSQGQAVVCTPVDLDKTYTIMQSASGEVAHHIVIKDWKNAKICLAGINIKNAYMGCTMLLNSASVTLNLKEGTENQIKNVEQSNGHAAIGVDASSSLTIEGEGSLTASSVYSAVIGSPYDNEAAGDITIHSGTITAKGEYSVGIGSYQSSFGTITITGGKVSAEGLVGIGAYAYHTSDLSGKINISGGEVEAKGNAVSGIGVPRGVSCEISGGTVKAGPGTLKSQVNNVSGIGNGGEGFSSDYFGTLKISGGSVAVKKNNNGVGIGVHSEHSVSDKIVICGGTVSGDSINGDVKDKAGNIGNIVYKTTVDLSKAYSQPNTSLSSADQITNVTYGLKDVKTDDAKKIYIYLPKNNDGEKTYGSFGEMNYRGTIDANNDNQLERYISLTEASVSSKTDVTASVHVTSDTDGVVYYAVSDTELTSGEAVKSAAEAENGAIGAGRAICAKGAVTNCDLEGLTANTSYKAYFASYADGIYSDVQTVEFTTDKPYIGLEEGASVSASGTYGMNLTQLTPVLSGKVVTATGAKVTGTWSFSTEQTVGGSKVHAAAIYPDKNETRSFTAQFTPTNADVYGNTLTTKVIPAMSDLTVSNDVVASLADTNKSTRNTDWYVGDVTVNAPTGYLISTTAGTGADSWSTSLTVSADRSGDYTYYLRDNGTDSTTKNGITAAKTITINKDSTKPVLGTASYKQGTDSIIAELWNWLIGKSVITVSIPVTEAGSGIAFSDVSINLNKDTECTLDSVNAGNVALTGSTTEGYTLSFTIPEEFIGTYSVQVSDQAGNAADGMNNEPVNGKVVVDTTAPQITLQANGTTIVAAGTDAYKENITFAISVTDAETSSGLKEVSYSLDNAAAVSLGTFSDTKTTSASNISLTIEEKGAHTLKLIAEDQAGNQQTQSTTFKIYQEANLSLTQNTAVTYDGDALVSGTDFISVGEDSHLYRW